MVGFIFPFFFLVSLTQTLKKSDVVLDVNGTSFEAAIFINDWVYELKIGEL